MRRGGKVMDVETVATVSRTKAAGMAIALLACRTQQRAQSVPSSWAEPFVSCVNACCLQVVACRWQALTQIALYSAGERPVA